MTGSCFTGAALKFLLPPRGSAGVIPAFVFISVVPGGTVVGRGGLFLRRPVPEAEGSPIHDDLGLVVAVSLRVDTC